MLNTFDWLLPHLVEERTMSTTPTRYTLIVGPDQYDPAYVGWSMMSDENDGRVRPDLHSNGSIEVADMPTTRDGWLALVEALQPAGTRLLTAEAFGYGWEAGAKIAWVTV